MAYHAEEYPTTKAIGLNLCSNVRDILKDSMYKANNSFDTTESVLFSANSKYLYKVEKHIAKVREVYKYGMAESWIYSSNYDMDIILEQCKAHAKLKKQEALSKLSSEADIARQIAFINQDSNIKVTSIQIAKVYPTFYVAKHILDKYLHGIFFATNKPPEFGTHYLDYQYYAINKTNPNIIQIHCAKLPIVGFTTTIPFIEEIELLVGDSFHVIYEMEGVSTSSPVFVTEKEIPYLATLKKKWMYKEFTPAIPIRLLGSSPNIDKRTEQFPLDCEEVLRQLYVPIYNLAEQFNKRDLTNIEEIWFQQGINIDTDEYTSVEYLYKFFTWLKSYSSIDEKIFNKWRDEQLISTSYLDNPRPYLLENMFDIGNDLYKVILGYSYITEEVGEGIITKATATVIKGDKLEVKYAKNNRLIPRDAYSFSAFIGNQFNFGVHSNPIYFDTGKLILKVYKDKDTHTILTIHGLRLETIRRNSLPLEAKENLSWNILTYGDNPIEDFRRERDTTNISISDNDISGFIIPIWEHKFRERDEGYYDKGERYTLRVVERIYYDSLKLLIFGLITDTNIPLKLREDYLLSYLKEYSNPKSKNPKHPFNMFMDKIGVGVNIAAYKTIPTRSKYLSRNPKYLGNQNRFSIELPNVILGTRTNHHYDENHHLNNAVTGLYKHKVMIEPFFDIRDNYKKPMFNN